MQVKSCSCGRSFTREEWLALPFAGVAVYEDEDDGVFQVYEHRNCSCGSTNVRFVLRLSQGDVRTAYPRGPEDEEHVRVRSPDLPTMCRIDRERVDVLETLRAAGERLAKLQTIAMAAAKMRRAIQEGPGLHVAGAFGDLERALDEGGVR